MKAKKPVYMDYPAHHDSRSGCKVGWYIYVSENAAKLASKAAVHNAELQRMQGYDFGYCSPGSISKLDDGRFEVCIP